jgi:hypothetical protein
MIKPKSVQSCGSKVPIQEYAGIRQKAELEIGGKVSETVMVLRSLFSLIPSKVE